MLNETHLHDYQRAAVDHIMANPSAGLFLDMGLGKTVSTLTSINKLMFEEMDVNKVLIVAPKRVAENVWTSEIKKWAHLQHLTISRIKGNQKQRRHALQEDADIYTVSRDNIAWLCGQYGGSSVPFDMLVIDESSSFKNPKSIRFKALKLVLGSFSRVVILTGTPAPNGLLDLWSQIYLLDKGKRLGKYIGKYRNNYFTPGRTNGHIVYSYNIKDMAEQEIFDRIGDICMSMKAKDYLTLPDRIDNYINIEFPEELRKRYDDFEEEQVLELLEAVDGDIDEISPTNAAGMMNKLLQFANGAVYDDEKNYHVVHDLKLDALESIIEEANGKPVLIGYAYQSDLDRIMKRLKKYKPVKLKTEKHINDWNAGKIRVMVMHPASGGHGLNLQEGGNILVWFGLTWSLELYMQFCARLHRQGQKFITFIHHLVAKGTYDDNIIRALKKKDAKQETLLEATKARIRKYAK